MTTQTNTIETKLSEANVSTTGSNSNVINFIADAIETVKIFGFESWLNQTTAGAKIKEIVKSLSC